MNLNQIAHFRAYDEEMWNGMEQDDVLFACQSAIPGGTNPVRIGALIFSTFPSIPREVGLNAAFHLRSIAEARLNGQL